MANRLFSPNTSKLGSVTRSALQGVKLSQEVAAPLCSSREYSNRSWRRKNTYIEQVLFGHLAKEAPTVWPDPNLGCLGATDKRLPLPGNIGLDKALLSKEKASPEQLKADKKAMEDEIKFWRSLYETPSNYQRQIQMLKQHEEVDRIQEEEMEQVEQALRGIDGAVLECKAHMCPDLLRRELVGLFPSRNITEGTLTVITLCQKTKADMSCWNVDVEEERETLIENFIKTAKEVCTALRKESVWADFVEPTSGKPYYSPNTNFTFFETDEKYRKLGFRIEDLGCCKVISHHKWGTHAFVGSIFTSAPVESESLRDILKRLNGDQ